MTIGEESPPVPDARTITTHGLIHHNMQRYEQALADFSRAIELGPGYAWAFASRSKAYWRMKQYGKALDDFNRAVDLRRSTGT